jgi:uncharacterized protein
MVRGADHAVAAGLPEADNVGVEKGAAQQEKGIHNERDDREQGSRGAAVSRGHERFSWIITRGSRGSFPRLSFEVPGVRFLVSGGPAPELRCPTARARRLMSEAHVPITMREAKSHNVAQGAEDMAPSVDIIAAIKAGDVSRVRRLLEDDPRLASARSDAGEPALLLAIYHRQREVADLLVAAGAEIDVFTAAAGGYLDRLQDIVERGSASVNDFSRDGWTPLHLAAFFGQNPAANYLLDRHADLSAVSRNETGNTPLHAAVAARQTALAELLLSRGADVNASSGGGWRPLHSAANNGDLPSIELLISKGAEINPLSSDGKTPLSMAQAKDQRGAVELLRRHRAI